MKTKNLHIDLIACQKAKSNCRLVSCTELGKIVTAEGIIRDILIQLSTATAIAVLENGLPIPTQHLLSVQRMEG